MKKQMVPRIPDLSVTHYPEKKPNPNSKTNVKSLGTHRNQILQLNKDTNKNLESKANPSPDSIKIATEQMTQTILVDNDLYNEKRIRELIQTNNVLSHEIEALQKKISERDFFIKQLTLEVKDYRQNYDKVKSVLDQKLNPKDVNKDNQMIRSDSVLRSKKQGVSGESFSSSSVEMKIYEKPESAMRLIEMALKGCRDDFLKKLEPSQVIQICQCMYAKTVKANVFIIQEGEIGEHMYVLESGKMEVIKDGKKLRDMDPGELFGELAVLQNCLRTASVRSLTEASFWTISRKIFQTILQKSHVKQLEEHRTFLQSVEFLKTLSNEELSKIVDALIREEYRKGEYIVKEGEEGQTFYIIKQGQVKVEQKIPESTEFREIRKLKTGDYFGERALLKDEIRTASVVADSDLVEVLTLDRDDFIRLIGDNDELNNKNYEDEDKKKQLPKEIIIKDEKEHLYSHVQLNDLEIIAILGTGGFGRVELVRYQKDPSLVFALKSLNKQYIIEMKQENHVFSERDILREVKSSFICQLYKTYRDDKYVYFLLEACLGGEVWTILRNKSSFDDRTTKFILGCVILAINYLHSKGIIYRDLKPENLLFDKIGYVKLCDFGFAKNVGNGRKTFTFCGTPEYVAPEIILNKGHDYAVDIWSLGILVFELHSGSPPFEGDDPMKIYNLILKGIEKIEFPLKFNKITQLFIKSLCKENATERLGYGKSGILAIMNHKYYSRFNWEALARKEMQSTIIPKLESNIDTHYFDKFDRDNNIPKDELSGWDIGFEW